MIPIARPSLGSAERDCLLEVLRTGVLAQGPFVRELEDLFAAEAGVEHAVAVSSGTAALHLALLALGVGPGDEVVTSPFTFVATVNAILLCGARPVFVDIDPQTYNLDVTHLPAALTRCTRAVLPVHLYGQMCDMTAVLEVAAAHDVAVLEDASQAVGAALDGHRAGGAGLAGTFSLYATKNATSGEGGVITIRDVRLADRLRRLRNHGARGPGDFVEVGYNYRLSELHAAVGVAQMRRLRELTEARKANADVLSSRLRTLSAPWVVPGARHVWHHYAVRVSPPREQSEVAAALADAGVGSAVHYATPLHQLPHVRAVVGEVSLPEAERAAREVLCLPVHPELKPADLETIVEAVNAA